MSPALSVNNLLSYLYAEAERSEKWNEHFLNDKIITQYTGVMKLSRNGKQCVAFKGICKFLQSYFNFRINSQHSSVCFLSPLLLHSGLCEVLGACPSGLGVMAGLQPGQVASLSQGHVFTLTPAANSEVPVRLRCWNLGGTWGEPTRRGGRTVPQRRAGPMHNLNPK